jgi:hypothetical protein
VKTNVDLRTVDLSAYPDLVVIYLGMRVRTVPGIKTLLAGVSPLARKSATLAGVRRRYPVSLPGRTRVEAADRGRGFRAEAA